MTSKKSLCAEEEAFNELMKWAETGYLEPSHLPAKKIPTSSDQSDMYEDVNTIKKPVVESWNLRLQTVPCDDGKSSVGLVNIVDNETKMVIAQNVEENIAKEICKRWNEASN